MAQKPLSQAINEGFQAVGTSLKTTNNSIGKLSQLKAEITDRTNLVEAINFTYTEAAKKGTAGKTTEIDDSVAASNSVYSSSKTEAVIEAKVKAEVLKITQDAPEAFDTLKEVGDWIQANTTAVTAISNKVPFNETKVLEDAQVQNVWTTLKLGDTSQIDFVKTFTDALAP
jgi:hypothetical protein